MSNRPTIYIYIASLHDAHRMDSLTEARLGVVIDSSTRRVIPNFQHRM